uniref:Replication protein E1 n=8 Tax=Human papillomavirus 39 TaxID=10588 RepID=T2A5V7_HPV39|nr:E1 [human papillomavirus 39]AGU90537.1 E1 [human papillomavirus 39]
MANHEGTDGDGSGCNGWFLVQAIVDKQTGDTVSEDEDENATDTGSDLADFIDDSTDICVQAERETAQVLLHMQEAQRDAQAVRALKRKYTDSSGDTRPYGKKVGRNTRGTLQEISLNVSSTQARQTVYSVPDSGYGNMEVETAEVEEVTVATNTNGDAEGEHGGSDAEGEHGGSVREECSSVDSAIDSENQDPKSPTAQIKLLLQSNNKKAAMLTQFKETYGLSFTDLVRTFKSDKTTCTDWVAAIFGVHPTIAEGFKTLINKYALYTHIQSLDTKHGVLILMLIRYTCGKNRVTVGKGLSTLLHVPESCMLLEPPKLRSPVAALYWYRTGISNISVVTGDTPEWIQRLTVIQHGIDDSVFDLSDMVQWAFDNEYTDESDIAFNYAMLADCNSNAAAFLKSNCQAKYVKDCATMCKHYKRAQKRQMSMSQWIKFRCSKCDEGGDWRPIVQFLRYQGIEFISFLCALKEFLKGTPKKNCIVIYGPANTGKSHFCMSLMHFLQGTVISYVNSTSHFWLEPLADAKLAMLDDATGTCWSYFDNYMRNALDGYAISLDRKYKSLLQMKCPPLLITSNTNPVEDDRWPYLRSRLTVFKFPNAFPFDQNRNPVYTINDKNWKCFFEKTWCRLDLQQDEDEGDNDENTFTTFKCVTGQNPRIL